jgi:hypothetical protein
MKMKKRLSPGKKNANPLVVVYFYCTTLFLTHCPIKDASESK